MFSHIECNLSHVIGAVSPELVVNGLLDLLRLPNHGVVAQSCASGHPLSAFFTTHTHVIARKQCVCARACVRVCVRVVQSACAARA